MTTRVTAPRARKNFSRLKHVLDLPNLIDIQKASFDWFLDEGLRETIDDISPIEDYTGTLAVEFGEYRFGEPPVSIKECREKDLTYQAPLSMTVRFVNKETGEIREQTVFMGDFPMMTEWGTFIINGTERVIVTQLVRSPGAYLMEPKDPTKQVFTANLMPSRGSWLELEIDKKGIVFARIDRKRKLPITTLLRALPAEDPSTGVAIDTSTNEALLKLFDNSMFIVNTLEKDPAETEDQALIEVFKKQRPGEPPTLDNARNLLRALFFDPKRYDLTKVGRYKLNQRLDVDVPEGIRVLTKQDIVSLVRKLVELPKLLGVEEESKDYAADAIALSRTPIANELDEYEHFGNRRLRTVGELIQEAFRVGLYRMERVVRERMTTEDVDTITPQTIINIRPVVAALKEFFGSSQLSQFLDQTNSLSSLTHRRRLSALGAGGLTRERAPIEVRDVHPTHYGRMCPIETPEGPNIGLISSLASMATVSEFGFIQTPYRRVVNSKVTDEIVYLDAIEEAQYTIAQASERVDERTGKFEHDQVLCRSAGGEAVIAAPKDVDFMDVAPAQIVSVATALIPFLEHNDANRALMGANMQRQAVPLMITQAPLVGTGLEYRAAVDTGDVVLAETAGQVTDVDAEKIVVETKDGKEEYPLTKFMRSNQGTLIHQKPIVGLGERVKKEQVLADGSSTRDGELALGANLLVAFMPWEGYNFEDAIVLSERLVKEDVLSSIHIHEYEIDARSTKLGDEEITRDIPNRSEESLRNLDDRGIVRIGAEVGSGDLLVGKVTPKGETELTAEEKLIRAIFKEKAREVRDTSLKVPHGEGGVVIDVKTFSRDAGDDLSPGVNELVRVYVAKKRKIAEGDKLAGRHGNKGVIAKIVPEEDMPFIEDGTPVDVVLNPLGVPSRMNIGQILETHLGWAAAHGVFAEDGEQNGPTPVASPVFDGATPIDVDEALMEWTRQNPDHPVKFKVDEKRPEGRRASGKVRLFDGRTGEAFKQKVTVGYMYILKLLHLVDDKIHARSTGPYSLVTQQPLGGKAQFGGQRFGEMEVWALEAYGAAYTLQEMLTIKSDDTVGRVKAYEAIVKGENIAEPSIPESFKVLLKEMQSLALDVHVLSEEGGEVEVREEDDELLRAAEELGIDLSPGSLRAAARPPTAEELEEGQERVDQDGDLALPADEALGDLDDVEVSPGGRDGRGGGRCTGRSPRGSGHGGSGNRGVGSALIDINDFDAIRIGLASSKQIRDWSSGEVTKPETINYRTLKPERDGLFCERIFGPTKDWECYCGKYKRVRYKGIICERCGVEVTRQKVRRERMGHIDLAAPVSHIWFFKGVPSRIGYLLDIAPRELEKVLYFAASIVTAVDVEARAKDVAGLEDQVEAEKERIYVDRDEALAALEDRLSRRRDYFTKGKESRNFDEDDDFWVRGLSNWAEEAVLPPLDGARDLVGGIFKELAKQITTEDSKKIRELVRDAAIRPDRKLNSRELEQVALAAEQIRDSIAPLTKQFEKAAGAKKGAITKHINRVLDALLDGTELHEEDVDLVSKIDMKNLDKARTLGKGLLAETLEKDADVETPEDLRELVNDLCLKTDGKIQKEDLDAIVQWSLKVREMYQDIEQRRADARDAAEDSRERLDQTWLLFKDLEPKLIVNDEQLFRELKDRFGSPYGFGVYFRGGMGAESIRELLKDLDLKAEAANLRETIRTSKGQKQQRAIKRLKVVNAFITSENRPEWMVLEAVPVIPPELRPMVQLDGGRFATSDLNDLYRRVINRNNRLKRLLDLGAPEIIVNNEKRMLQEAVDALFDNGRRGRAVTGPGNRPLKSLSDMLKGKQGRFRQNLLGKRVDYSGRSVIVAGPYLKLHQCGLPKLMALELFKPFIMSRLVERKTVQNIKAAKKYVDSMTPEVWDVLEEVIAEHPVLLNRAPTLHRLGIQAFEPVLVEGKAIQVHPLVCHAFNADFDGDQMAVHVPLSAEAQAEARILMLSANNILSPAHGRPLATPSKDMVLGLYFLTYSVKDLTKADPEKLKPRPKRFQSEEEIELALEADQVQIQQPIEYRFENGETIVTTPGRVIFNAEVEGCLSEAVRENGNSDGEWLHPYMNATLSKREMDTFLSQLSESYGAHAISTVLDKVKSLGFHYATLAGVTISKNDVVIPPEKNEILDRYEVEVQLIEDQYFRGLITDDERKDAVRNKWTEATDEVADAMERNLNELNPIFMMANSGARGSMKQIRQLAGMRGLMANPKGEIIERPIKANFMEGLSVLEYFISTHGARKGLADTALRTADSGYLTRRLVDVAQDVIIRDEDCGTENGIVLPLTTNDGPNRSLYGRLLPDDLRKPLASGRPGKTVLAERGAIITKGLVEEFVEELGADATILVRSVLKCRSEHGVCRSCYGIFLATGELAEIGDAVGIIAAQSIGEPGTQLTMRTFHTGGVAGADITHGLPRVVEIFEARNPKGAAVLAEITGRVTVEDTERGPKITLTPDDAEADEKEYQLPRRTRLLVKKGNVVEPGDPLNEGSIAPAELLELHAHSGKGSTETEVYLVGEVQKVYRSQGVDIHDKHIELIVRQMLKKVRVENPGDTELLPGQLVDKVVLEHENLRVKKEKGKKEEATFEPLILGITKASLATESFLSAASFQETTKVLTDASIEGKIDRLLGLKENVIIGKLIPAATGLKRYRTIDIGPSKKVPPSAYTRPATEEQLLAALQEIGGDGEGLDLKSLGLDFGGTPGADTTSSHDAGEAEETPEVDSPLDE